MKCDIIILVWNELRLTKDCIESLTRHTRYPYRLILIDNGSRQETMEYLRGLKERRDIEISLIRNEQNLGFVKAVNQGLNASDAPYVCLLNNDTLLSEDWLSEMIEVSENNPQIGILNPSSNTLGQYLRAGDTVDSYAEGLKDLKGKWQEMSQCVGFCMLVKRAVIGKIGLLDEIFSPYFFEESDFCRRARAAGFKCARAKGSYVYHEGSATSKKRPYEKEQMYKKNYDIFCRKWGRPLRIAYIAANYTKINQDSINEIALSAARDSHHVWLFLKKHPKGPRGVPDHFNINFFWFNRYFYHICCVYKILKRKRKKGMDIIFTNSLFLGNIFEKLKFYHEADVLLEPSLEKAKGLWKQKSVYN